MKKLARILLELVMFIELSGPEVVDEDDSVRLMEYIVTLIGELGSREKHALIEAASELASDTDQPQSRRRFLEDFERVFVGGGGE